MLAKLERKQEEVARLTERNRKTQSRVAYQQHQAQKSRNQQMNAGVVSGRVDKSGRVYGSSAWQSNRAGDKGGKGRQGDTRKDA